MNTLTRFVVMNLPGGEEFIVDPIVALRQQQVEQVVPFVAPSVIGMFVEFIVCLCNC